MEAHGYDHTNHASGGPILCAMPASLYSGQVVGEAAKEENVSGGLAVQCAALIAVTCGVVPCTSVVTALPAAVATAAARVVGIALAGAVPAAAAAAVGAAAETVAAMEA